MRKLDNVFVDESNNIYFYDKAGMLYLYDEIKNTLYPFLMNFTHVKQVSKIYNKYYVLTNNSIAIFNSRLESLENYKFLDNGQYYELYSDKIHYYHSDDSLYYLFERELYCICDFTTLRVTNRSKIKNICDNLRDFVILQNYLLIHKDISCEIYKIKNDNLKHIATLDLSIDEFKNIVYIDKKCNLIFSDSSIYNLDSNDTNYLNELDVDIYYYFNKIVAFLNGDELIIFYDDLYKPLIYDSIFKIKNFQKCGDICMTIYDVENFKCSIIQKNNLQVFMCNNKIYIMGNNNGNIANTNYNFNNINNFNYEHINKLDISIDIPLIPQIMDTISMIYRNNTDKKYEFDIIDNITHDVISYGTGATRQVFSIINKELGDEINNIENCNYDLFGLGQLFYFVFNKSRYEKYEYIDNYFFYLICKEIDYKYLFITCKKYDGDKYYKFYKQLLCDDKLLDDIDIEVNTPIEYVDYILSCDLSQEKKECYKQFVSGFLFFLKRDKLLEYLPLNYFIEKCYTKNLNNFKIRYDCINTNIEDENMFEQIFNKLTTEELSNVKENITGTKYFNGTINIVFDNIDTNILYNISTCYNELTIYNEASNDILSKVIESLKCKDNLMIN